MDTTRGAELALKLLENPTLSFGEKQAIASKFFPDIKREIRSQDAKLASLNESARDLRIRIESAKEMVAWLESVPPVVEANQTSKLHILRDAVRAKRIFNYDTGVLLQSEEIFSAAGDPTFLVKHDWHGALADGLNIEAHELRLPYPLCFFEFRISGKSVIVFAGQVDGYPMTAMCFVEGKNGYWFTGEAKDKETGAGTYCWKQVMAVCVALDAQVATHEVIRAPAALNHKRQRQGKPLMPDYRIVDLAKRYRTESLGNETERHVRLHFRRGHWRHLETHKTWIRWMLVGDPSLGFVGKRYSL